MRYFVKELSGEEVDLAYFQRTGFNTPVLVKKKAGLEMSVPSTEFTVSDVKNLVGARRTVDVMDCKSQKNCQMTMKEWEEYYNNESAMNKECGEETTERRRQLNVISLEFSFTKLEPLVVAPKVIRQVDWTNHVWPRHLKENQTEGTNDLREMWYPKVQKYCLMSVKGCYTDFHIDFGGTSVWYHILKGKKIFWLVPPTEPNLKAYEQWTLSGRQGDVFFGDLVDKCGMITLEAGHTFFIPSGWIHAVYTPEDSLVFGGNFLHSYAIEKQIRVAQIEEITKVPQKFRFPFFTELQWYALDKYVYALLGRTHLDFDEELRMRLLGNEHETTTTIGNKYITPQELFGLKAIVMYIHALPVSKKSVPLLLKNAVDLVRDIRVVVNQHKEDTLEQAVTGKPLLFWPGVKDDKGISISARRVGGKASKKTNREAFIISPSIKKETKAENRERIRCKVCQPCISSDCAKCSNCEDMIKFGGSGRLKRPCQRRTCIQPLLPINICCSICGLDGWYAETNMRLVDRPPGTCALMECCFCQEISHPTCVTDYGVDGYIKMDLPNSWECPRCIKIREDAKAKEEPKEEPVPMPAVTTGLLPPKMPKIEPEDPLRRKVSSGSDANIAGSYQLFSVKGSSDQPKHVLRAQLSEQIVSGVSQPLKKPQYVFRPPPSEPSAKDVYDRRKKKDINLRFEPCLMLPVFQRLNTTDLANCAVVCKSWNKIAQDPSLWSTVRLCGWKLTPHLLSLIVLRQPTKLLLDCSHMGRQQLAWLLPRIPQTRVLSLAGLDFLTSVTSLSTANTPMLHELDLSFVTSLNDSAIYKLLSAPRDSRPGLLDKKSRLKNLKKLNLSNTEISDVSLRYISQYLQHLNSLSLCGCWKVTNDGLAQLSMPEMRTAESLEVLDIAGCKQISGLQNLSKCKNLSYINCTGSSVPTESMRKFIEDSSLKLKLTAGSVVCKKAPKK